MTQLMRIDTINALEEFMQGKKRATLEAIGNEASEETVNIFVRGFLRQILERIQDLCPDLRQVVIKSKNGDFVRIDNNSRQAGMTRKHFPSQPNVQAPYSNSGPVTPHNIARSQLPVSPEFRNAQDVNFLPPAETALQLNVRTALPLNDKSAGPSGDIRHETPDKEREGSRGQQQL